MIFFRRCLMSPAGGEGGGAGGGDAGGAGTGDAGDGSGGNPPKTGEAAKEGAGDPPAGYVPAESLRAVTAERDKFKRAAEAAERKDLEAKGEHEKLAATEKTRADAAEARATSVARRAAFIGAAAGKVTDASAAFTLAREAGLTEFDVDDDGAPKDAKVVEAAIAEVVKRYPFLTAKAAGGRDFGSDRGGTTPGASVDVEKLTPLEKMMMGIPAPKGGG